MLGFLLACAREEVVAVTPDHGPSSGYYRVAVDVAAAGIAPEDVAAVTVGGIAAYDLAAEDGLLAMTVQGAPSPGPAAIVVDGTPVVAFTYDPPIDAVFDRMVATGASLTQGIQSGVPSDHGALASPGAVVARQAGGVAAAADPRAGPLPAGDAGDARSPARLRRAGHRGVRLRRRAGRGAAARRPGDG
ncbi:MAG: hypothetical protein ACOZNI_16130 [Myxococcota bacterium]